METIYDVLIDLIGLRASYNTKRIMKTAGNGNFMPTATCYVFFIRKDRRMDYENKQNTRCSTWQSSVDNSLLKFLTDDQTLSLTRWHRINLFDCPDVCQPAVRSCQFIKRCDPLTVLKIEVAVRRALIARGDFVSFFSLFGTIKKATLNWAEKVHCLVFCLFLL